MNELGTIVVFFGDTVQAQPAGEEWMICDGSQISRGTYSDLYNLIGDMFGSGDNISTFNIPDMRNYFVRGLDDGPSGKPTGRDPDSATRQPMAQGGRGGNTAGSVQADWFRGHTHPLSGKDVVEGSFDTSVDMYNPDDGGGSWGSTDPNGGSETRPKNVAVNFLIRVS